MRIAILGSTGRTGTLVLSEAVARGHQVTALVRAPGSLQNHRAVTMVEGDIYDPDALARTIDGTKAVISAVGARGRTKDLHTMLARNTITAMNSAGVERFVGSASEGSTSRGTAKARGTVPSKPWHGHWLVQRPRTGTVNTRHGRPAGWNGH